MATVRAACSRSPAAPHASLCKQSVRASSCRPPARKLEPIRRLVAARPRASLIPKPACISGRNAFSHAFVDTPVIISSGGLSNVWCQDMWRQLQLGRSPQPSKMCRGCVKAASVLPSLGTLWTLVRSRLPTCLDLGHPLWLTPPAIAVMAFAIWGLTPTLRFLRRTIFRRKDYLWDESRTRYIMASYVRPVIIWIAVLVICRSFDPVVLASETSQAIKHRFVNFVRSLSTVLAFAFCTASLTQRIQKFMVERQGDAEESRNLGVQFVGNTVYTLVWVAAVILFMELLGFSTQKWITAGGFGTVLLTLAGRELVTNFLSSIMIHATRPFMVNEWIQTKIEGQEVSGTVEHVGWWEPTIIRGDDREAVHIPNHKFSVSVVRNLSQKTHWRIKTFFGISHYDVGKIGDIVATMRKVISKHPQLEQKHLHRRVVLEHVNPDNQALMIMVSCFVKTSHFEEYMRVKEEVLLDLLNVISFHGARLATPIRSVQRIYEEAENRGVQYRDVTPAEHEHVQQPFLLLDTQQRVKQQTVGDDLAVNGTVVDDAQPAPPVAPSAAPTPAASPWSEQPSDALQVNSQKSSNRSAGGDAPQGDVQDLETQRSRPEEIGKVGQEKFSPSEIVIASQVSKAPAASVESRTEEELSMPADMPASQPPPLSPKVAHSPETRQVAKPGISVTVGDGSKSIIQEPSLASAATGKGALEGLDSMGLNSRDITLLGAAFDKLPANIPEGPVGPYAGIPQGKGEKLVLDERFVRAKAGPPSPSTRPGSDDIAASSADERHAGAGFDALPSIGRTGSLAFDPSPPPDSTAGLVSSGGVAEPIGVVNAASMEDRHDRLTEANALGSGQKQGAVTGRSQSVEENLVLEVALGGPKRVLDLPLDGEPPSQLTSSNGKESSKDDGTRQLSNSGASEPELALSGSRNSGTVPTPSD